MTEILYNSKQLKELINTPNIITKINKYLKRMEDDRLSTIILPLTEFSKKDILIGKNLLDDNGFKTVLMKDPSNENLYHSIIIALPKD